MKKLNRKLMGIFLSVSMIAAFSSVASAKIKTAKVNLEVKENTKVSDIAKCMVGVTKYDRFMEKEKINGGNIISQNMLCGAGNMPKMENGGKIPLFIDYTDKDQQKVKNIEKIEDGVNSNKINEIEIKKEDVEESKKKTVKEMKLELKKIENRIEWYDKYVKGRDKKDVDYKEAGKELLKNEVEILKEQGVEEDKIQNFKRIVEENLKNIGDLAKSNLNLEDETVKFYKDSYKNELEQKIKKVETVKPEEVEKAQKDVNIVEFKDFTKETEESIKNNCSKEDYEKMKKAEEELEKSLILNK